MRKISDRQGMISGLAGGLAGTIVMDLFVAGLFTLTGLPASLIFSFIGDTAQGFFSLLGMDLAGGIPLGAAIHYLIGLVLGLIFGLAASRVDALKLDRTWKAIGIGILYIEVVSLPILATAPPIMKMTLADTLQCFGLSMLMHPIYGLILGVFVSRRLPMIAAKGQMSVK